MPNLFDPSALAHVIDDYVVWFTVWHRVASEGDIEQFAEALKAPASFAQWRENAFAELTVDQPVIERLAALHEQLHTTVRLVLMKAPAGQRIASVDDASVTAKYLELMQGLRRCESAFAAAACGLDPLTGLRLRGELWRDLENELQRFARSDRPFCIAMMDIDHFKKVNDAYGHQAGDHVLAAVANHVSRSIRAHDDAFRVGGEEFLLCLKEVDLVVGLQILERLRAGLAKTPVTLSSGVIIPVTASFGLTMSTKMTTANELLRRADAALYRAKQEGRNRIVTADAQIAIEGRKG